MSTLHVAVRGAASIAEHALRHGDRVGILDLGRPERRVPTRAGRRQLNLVTDYLLDTGHGFEHRSVVDRPLTSIGDGALVIVLSPLIGASAAEHAMGLARTGRSVLVVDTLSDDVGRPDDDKVTALAWRIVALQRDATVESLRLQGIPVVTWRGSGSLDQVLRELSPAARSPRLRP